MEKNLGFLTSQRGICKRLQTGRSRLIFGVDHLRSIRKHFFDGAHFFSQFFLMFSMIRGQIGVKTVFASKVHRVVPPSDCLDLWITKINFSNFFDHFDVREDSKTSFLSLFRLKNGSNDFYHPHFLRKSKIVTTIVFPVKIHNFSRFKISFT